MRTSLRRPFIADAVFADCGGSPYTVDAAAALTLGRKRADSRTARSAPTQKKLLQLHQQCSAATRDHDDRSHTRTSQGSTVEGASGRRRAPAARHCTSALRALPTGKAAWSFR